MGEVNILSAIRSEDPRKRSEALQELYRSCYPRIKVFVMTNSGSEQDAKDVFQEGIVAFYENIYRGSFREASKIDTYLFSICKNVWLQRLKKTKRSDNLLSEMKLTNEDDEITINSVLLDSIFAELKKDCQEILISFYYDKMSIRELQVKLDMNSEQVVKNKKARCLRYLMNITKKKKLNLSSFFNE